ncbi:MAG: hypothetical protein JJV98_14810 [Desulfosarcina sp.]|nr:hypothetical protein [Desulfobacterales bacterium]
MKIRFTDNGQALQIVERPDIPRAEAGLFVFLAIKRNMAIGMRQQTLQFGHLPMKKVIQ